MSALAPQWRNINFLRMELGLLAKKIAEQAGGGETKHIVNISGGKDSDAVYCLAVEAGIPFQPVFADTGHEHISTYEHVALLPERTGGPEILWVRADFTEAFAQRRENIAQKWPFPHKNYPNGLSQDIIDRALRVMHPTGDQFLDLCLLRGGFPSMKRKFCTDHLKIKPVFNGLVEPLYEQGYNICQWLGIRRDESHNRKSSARNQLVSVKDVDYWLYRPILEWTVGTVMAMHRRHGLPINPLYLQGATRVGCWPCINARKSEIRIMAEMSPEAVDKLEEWEDIVTQASKQGCATFFFTRNIAKPGEAFDHKKHGIRAQVDWARTVWGGKQYALLPPEKSSVERAWEHSSNVCQEGFCE